MGLGQGFLFVPIIPEVIDSIYEKQGIIEGEDENVDGIIGDKAAGLYGSFYSIGLIIAPLFGAFLYDEVFHENFNLTCDMFALIAAGWTIIFLLFNVLPDIFAERKEKENIIKQ